MPENDEEKAERLRREKTTLWLVAGGAASLLLPLLGLFLMRSGDVVGRTGSSRSDVFERREAADRRVAPAQLDAPAPLAVPQPKRLVERTEAPASSLDFIKPNEELKSRAAEPKAAAPPSAAAPAPAAKSKAPAKKAPARKTFAKPKLQPSRGFTRIGPKGSSEAGAGEDAGDMQELLKNLPPEAANDPQLQQYLKR